MVTLLSEILEEPFPSKLTRFPFPQPCHSDSYARAFACPIEFGKESMEWHFDANVLTKPYPGANSLTANICQDFCKAMIDSGRATTPLQRELRSFMLANSGRRTTSAEAAKAVGLSKRTLFRRLQQQGSNFQSLLDETRASLACEYLENTDLAVSAIADRCGFADEANFRRAFHGWRNKTPSQWRRSVLDI